MLVVTVRVGMLMVVRMAMTVVMVVMVVFVVHFCVLLKVKSALRR